MDPETLVTFLFKAPPQVRTVELLGSWDNFTQAYRMHHDRRRGKGLWSGCFRFDNIIFDGDLPHWTKPRSGGLKQGGVYWYYYRLDYDVEAYDDLQACTADCPLMPGQMMNFMDVPMEIVEPPSRCRSACYAEGLTGTLGDMRSMSRQTLEPSDKFAALEPPPVSKVHGRCISDLALGGRLEGSVQSQRKSSLVSPPSPTKSQHAEIALERPTSKRRRSSDRPASRQSQLSEPSPTRSCRYASVVDDYAAESPIIGPHPNPLSSAPVDDETRAAIQNNFEGFNFGLNGNPDGFGESEVDFEISDEYRCQSTQSLAWDEVLDNFPYRLPSSGNSELDIQPRASSLPKSLIQTDQQPPNHAPPDHSVLHPSPSPEPTSSPDQLEICSPTFSAATLSSNGGLNTPYRLSAGYSRGTTASTAEPPQALDEISDRLKRLGTAATPSANQSPAELEKREQPSFTGYALPEPAIGSVQSLGKMSTPRGGLLDPMGASLAVPLATGGGGSIVEDIFSELGYLGGSIS